MLMSPSIAETSVHGCHCSRDMAVRMREVMVRPWVGVCAPSFDVLVIRYPLSRACRGGTAVRFPVNSSHMCCMELALDDRLRCTHLGSKGFKTRVLPGH